MLEPGFKPTQFNPRVRFHTVILWGLSGTLSDVYLKDYLSNVITGYLYFVTVSIETWSLKKINQTAA